MSELNPAVEVVQDTGVALDDATIETPNNMVEVEESGQALTELLEQSATEVEQDKTPAKEPGWVRKRIDSALQKQLPEMVAVEVAKVRAEYEAKIQPLLERQLTRDAADLVSQGEFKSQERALEYLRLKQGLPVQAPVETAIPRNERGQFVAQEEIPQDVRERAAHLMAQAEYAKKMDDIDPMSIYRSDPNVARLVNSGQWDFADVVKAAKNGQAAPAPIRSSNAATPQKRGPLELTSEEFRKLNENLGKGVRVDMRR